MKVLPTVVSLDERFLNSKDLAALPKIGPAAASVNNQRLPFALYASQLVKAFHPNSEESLALFQPSRTLTDDDRSMYTFRITAVDPAHKPVSMDEVGSRWRKTCTTRRRTSWR